MHAKNSPALADGSSTHSSPSAAVIVSAALALATLSGCQSQQATNSPPVRDSDIVASDGASATSAPVANPTSTPSLAMVANDQARREADGLSRQLGIQIESLATTPQWYAAATNDAARVGGTASAQTLSGAVQSALANANRAGAARGLDVKTMRVERAAYKRLPTGTYAAWAAMGDGSNMGALYAPIDLSETVVAQVPATELGTASSTTQATTTSEPAPQPTPPASTLPSLSQPRAAVQTAEGTPLAKAPSATTATTASSTTSAAPAAASPAATSIAAQPTPPSSPQTTVQTQPPATSALPTLANPSVSVNSATGAATPVQPTTTVATPAATVAPVAPVAPASTPPSAPPTTPPSTQPPASTLPTLSNPGAKVNSATGEKPVTQAVSQPTSQPTSQSATAQPAAQPALATLANPRAQVVSAPVSPAAQSGPAASGASSASTLPTLSNPRAKVASAPTANSQTANAGASPIIVGAAPIATAPPDPNLPDWFTFRPLSKNGRTMIGVVTQAANAREATRQAITTGRDQLQAALGTPARELVTDKTKSITLPDGQVKMYSLISCSGVLPAQPQ